MKLNHNCVRDTLLFLEENLELGDHMKDRIICDNLQQYSYQDVMYTLKKLFEANYIKGNKAEGISRAGTVLEITMKGHMFLDDIRPQEAWDKVQEVTKTIGSASLKVLAEIASQVATTLISKNLGL